jgi:hypothetical protein
MDALKCQALGKEASIGIGKCDGHPGGERVFERMIKSDLLERVIEIDELLIAGGRSG